jgi:hypothetical protein
MLLPFNQHYSGCLSLDLGFRGSILSKSIFILTNIHNSKIKFILPFVTVFFTLLVVKFCVLLGVTVIIF